MRTKPSTYQWIFCRRILKPELGGGHQGSQLAPMLLFSEEKSFDEVDRSCEPADHERHLPSCCLCPSGSGRPRYGRQTLRSVVPAHLRSLAAKTGVPSL